MKKAFIVTGTPATGKTMVAKLLAKKHHACYVDISALIAQHHIYASYDRSLQTYVVYIKKLVPFLIKLIRSSKQLLVLDSHLSHYLPRAYVRRCYVTTCSLPLLKRRLERRKYSMKKIRENLDAEILRVCYVEAVLQKHKVTLIDTSKGLKKI